MTQCSLKTAAKCGAVVVILLVGVGLASLNLFHQSPNTLADAGLQGRSWSSSDEIGLARRVTHQQLENLASRLDDANRKGDLQIVWSIMPQATGLLSAWNDQSEEAKAYGHDCMLAALHLTSGLNNIAANTPWDRSRFNAAMEGCSP